MKEIIVNTLLILCIGSIIGIFTGLIMWIWIGVIGVKVLLTSIVAAIFFGTMSSAIDETW